MAQSDENILNDQNIINHLIQMRSQLTAIQTSLDGEIKNNLNDLKDGLQKHVVDDEKHHKDVDTRIRVVEDDQKKIKWLALGAGAVVAFIWKVADAFIQGHDFFHH